jgi:hypothetical protein
MSKSKINVAFVAHQARSQWLAVLAEYNETLNKGGTSAAARASADALAAVFGHADTNAVVAWGDRVQSSKRYASRWRRLLLKRGWTNWLD